MSALVADEHVQAAHGEYLEAFVEARRDQKSLWEDGDFIVNHLEREELLALKARLLSG